MTYVSKLVITMFATLVLLAGSLPMVASAASLVGPSWATRMVLYNASNADVVVMVVIQDKAATGNAPAQDGCPNDVRYLRYIDLTANGTPQPLNMFTNSATSWFKLKRGHQAQLYSLALNPSTGLPTYCLQGFNIGFGGISAQCPNTSMPMPITTEGASFNQQQLIVPPNGVNGFEGSINMPGIIAGVYTPGAQEGIDLTCLGGANAKLVMQVTPPAGGPYWTYNAGPLAGGGTITYTRTASFQNSWVRIVNGDPSKGCDDNCVDPHTGLARPAVFPYGCTICNAFPDPMPPCGTRSVNSATQNYSSQFCAAKNYLPSPNPGQNGCQLNRGAFTGQKFGGLIRVVYYGKLSPPSKCP